MEDRKLRVRLGTNYLLEATGEGFRLDKEFEPQIDVSTFACHTRGYK